ncbi:MAG: transporter substrate-binding domain-containing protein [Syntrophobacteraceae bacterium]|nr:transporter substrate-binding domain-containing protein [Syntrophobacteraceae bacterium]
MSENRKIGVQRGTSEAKWIEETLLKQQGMKFELVYYDSAPLAVEDVLNGRIASAAMDDAPARDAESKNEGGMLGWITETSLPAPLAVAARDLKRGEVSAAVLGMQDGLASPGWTQLQMPNAEVAVEHGKLGTFVGALQAVLPRHLAQHQRQRQ